MNLFKPIYRFLGSVYLAIMLIGAVAIFVIAGTLIESTTQSHRYAAQFTYSSPLFFFLLWGFFINILVSALHRWPFKVKHIPFLTTHIGLLMILGGILIKAYAGLQGSMHLMEGSGSNHINISDTYAVQVERKGEAPHSYPIHELNQRALSHHKELSLQLVNYLPHAAERLATWIKGDWATIQGLDPMPVHRLNDTNTATDFPLSGKVRFHGKQSPAWDVYALRIAEVDQIIDALYQHKATITLSSTLSGKKLTSLPLSTALAQPVLLPDIFEGGLKITTQLHTRFFHAEGFKMPALEIHVENPEGIVLYEITLPLNGDTALLNENTSSSYLGSAPIKIDIERIPALCILEDQCQDTHLVAFDAHGRVWHQSFGNNQLHSYISYDEGFGGYAVHATLPFPAFACDRKRCEEALKNDLSHQLQQALLKKGSLSPPLKMLQEACQQANVDFVETLIVFLDRWNKQYSWLYAKDDHFFDSLPAFQHLKWNTCHKKACQYVISLFEHIDPIIKSKGDLLQTLQSEHWPLLADCETIYVNNGATTAEKTASLLTLLTQQVFSVADQLPEKPSSDSAIDSFENQARLFSAYLRAYEIHLSHMMPILPEAEMIQRIEKQHALEGFSPSTTPVTIEAQMIAMQEAVPVSSQLENNTPVISLKVHKNDKADIVSLSYDRLASGLKWPILNGEYTLRFQPHFVQIPYRIRLRQARQINYANSQQPYSYESDIIITDARNGASIEKTISMNHVHETWDGYRFYLSNMTPADESAVKRIQIVVNHDPAKYWLTYPGAMILSCGIILLFWMRPYKKSSIYRK